MGFLYFGKNQFDGIGSQNGPGLFIGGDGVDPRSGNHFCSRFVLLLFRLRTCEILDPPKTPFCVAVHNVSRETFGEQNRNIAERSRFVLAGLFVYDLFFGLQ